jgi:hypothetical protein
MTEFYKQIDPSPILPGDTEFLARYISSSYLLIEAG